MAENPEELMSLMLDDMLSEDDEKAIKQMLSESDELDYKWQQMNFIDATFERAGEFAPSLDFTEQVMARVDEYEAERSWYPWVLALLIGTSMVALVTVAAPLLFFVLGLHNALISVPVIGPVFAFITEVVGFAVFGVKIVGEALLTWINFVTSDPMALGVVVGALAFASIYIGLRESRRATLKASN